jgi:hypothetical protein
VSFRSQTRWRLLGASPWSRLALVLVATFALSLAFWFRLQIGVPAQIRGPEGNQWSFMCRLQTCNLYLGDTLYTSDGQPWRLLALPGQSPEGVDDPAPQLGERVPTPLDPMRLEGWLQWFSEESQSPNLIWTWKRGTDSARWVFNANELKKSPQVFDRKWRDFFAKREQAALRGQLTESLNWASPQVYTRDGFWLRRLDGRGLVRPVAVDSVVGVLRGVPLRSWLNRITFASKNPPNVSASDSTVSSSAAKE